ncbi:MAG: hypothetical protein GX754_04910 [Clostridiaceae bacterium]|nr:hypothetical protein [Clostridiaceae bacterium]
MKQPTNLDDVKKRVIEHINTLWVEEEEIGGFRMGENGPVNLLSTTDIAWIMYCINAVDSMSPKKKKWIKWLQNKQDPECGSFRYEITGHNTGHAFWHTTRALNILGGQILHFPEYLREVMEPSGLRKWFSQTNWSSPTSSHHQVLGLVPILASIDSSEWVKNYFEGIEEQQDLETFTWPRGTGKANISRTFAYTALHMAAGKLPRRPEKIIDTILMRQQATGFWEEDPKTAPNFGTMDSAYLLIRIPSIIRYKMKEAIDSLDTLYHAFTRFFTTQWDDLKHDTHRLLAIVHTFGLLAEAFPERFISSSKWRFDWDKIEMYKCDVIYNEWARLKS